MGEPRVVVSKDGPLTVSGEVPLVRLAAAPDGNAEWRIEETLPPRASYALCRCGLSRMAPFCDYKHMRGFDGTEAPEASEAAGQANDVPPAIGFVRGAGRTVVGPLWVRGAVALISATGVAYPTQGAVALCRCGRSRRKPYCDGSHEEAAELS